MKKIIAFILSMAMLLIILPTSTLAAATPKYTEEAQKLCDLGLYNATGKDASGKPTFDLGKAPTRLQGVVMLLKMFGETNIALKTTVKCQFNDVPAGSEKYVAYACSKQYISGVTSAKFSPNDKLTASQAFIFILRILGYTEKDFVPLKSIEKARAIGLIGPNEYTNANAPFLNDDLVHTSFSALKTINETTGNPLYCDLISKGIINSKTALKIFIPAQKFSENVQKLYDLGLFNESDFSGIPIFSLNRAPTKLEATVMYIKILGKEQAALAVDDSRGEHPFTDVPVWAKKYVAYAYYNNFSSGTSATTFGSTDKITIGQFLTYVLRALEYDSTDFGQADSITKAEGIGLIPVGKYTNNSKLLFSDCADIIFSVLKLNKKLEGITLVQSLIYKGAINDITAAKYTLIPSAYRTIKVPIKLEGKNNLLYNKDVISAIPKAKFMDLMGKGSSSKMLFSYYLALQCMNINDLQKTATDASIYNYFTENYNNLNNYAGGKPGYGFTIATVYDASYNMIATAIFDAKSAIAAGNVEFVLINFDTQKYMNYLSALSNKIIGSAKELPNDVFYFERYKEMVTIIDKATGKQKGQSFLNNGGDYLYKIIINKDKYPEFAAEITGFNDIYINDQPITAESLKNEIKNAIADPFSNGRYIMSYTIDSCLSNWTARDYEWNRKRAFIFGDENGLIDGWVNYLPSQVKIIDVGTVKKTVYN